MIYIGIFILGLGIAGIALGWAAFFRVIRLEKTLAELSRRVDSRPRPSERPPEDPFPPAHTPVFDLDLPAEHTPPQGGATPPVKHTAKTPKPASPSPIIEHVKSQWMIWLGGLCVALAGIFMVRYGIEQGLIGPTARVGMGVLSGLLIHCAAEWLLRSKGHHPAFAALAGGASITLFASLFAALHLYSLVSANTAFILLALIALATMALSLRQGPMLAAIGLPGGYLVPLLVSSGSGNIAAAMVYALIITASGLLLFRFIFRRWLGWGLVTGVLGWWGLSLVSGKAIEFQGIYLAIAAYSMLAIPTFTWLPGSNCRGESPLSAPANSDFQRLLKPALLLFTIAWGISLAGDPITSASLFHWGAFVAVLGLAARIDTAFAGLTWLTLVLACIALGVTGLHQDPAGGLTLQLPGETAGPAFLAFAFQMTALYVWLGFLGLYKRPYSHLHCSLLCLAPLAWLAMAYLLTGDLSGSWRWSAITVIIGLSYAAIAGYRLGKDSGDDSLIWLILASHLAYSLAAAMYFREAGLTLVLAVQLVSLTALQRRYAYPWLSWLIKAAVAIVIIRLTLNPWLMTYPADTHWSLWTYGGCTVFCFLAARLAARGHPVKRWLEAAGLHLLVLTLGAEVRYWLYDGDIFADRYSLTEAAINGCLWAGLAITYYLRVGASEHLASLYRVLSGILLGLALASYLFSATVLNPLWSDEAVSSRPVFNLLLLAYGLPVLLMLLICRLFPRPVGKFAGMLAGVGAFLFISMEIRHLWQGRLNLELPTGTGELYTYSAVWLLIALSGLILGALKGMASFNRFGFILLVLVIGKIFLVDMSGLDGLLRVASFMGLGLSLLALAYLRSRLTQGDR